MSSKVAIKLAALMTALTFTVCAIIWLKQGHMNSFWTSLGFKTGDRINWCSERVETLHLYGGKAKLSEIEGKWFWIPSADLPKELDYLRVEKWFAKYCQVPVEAFDVAKMEASTPVFEALFIDNQRLSLYSDGENIFKIRDQIFRSETLRKALKELLAFGGEIQ